MTKARRRRLTFRLLRSTDGRRIRAGTETASGKTRIFGPARVSSGEPGYRAL